MNNRLSALIERARSHKPVTILTLIGVLVLPAILGGVLVAALQDPTQRLDTMTAAIVNDDKPVTVNGQLAPLGRQLAAGLVDGTGEKDENLTWVISNEKDAAAGLKNGTYQAVVRIPEGFSAAAVSGGTAVQDPAKPAKQATISVTTATQARAADGLIANQIANVAASTMGSEISQSTLKNVLVGFGTLGDKIGEAANGADKLATGAASAATGAGALPDGATKLADGAGQLSDGAGQLSSGLGAIADGITASQTGANQAGAGLAQGADALAAQGLVPAEVSGVAATAKEKADTAAANTASAAGAVGASAQDLGALAQQCATDPTIPAAFCQKVGAAAVSAGAAAAQLGDATKDVYVAAGYADGTVQALSQFNTAATAQVSGQLRTAADGINQLSAGLGQLADGTRQSATGAENLATGATGLQSGAAQLADGATQLSSGIGSLATGTSSLASGLHQAAASLPKHTDSESSSLAEVIANPVKADTTGGMFGPTAVPLLAAVVLWFGGLVSFLVMRPFTASALTSRRASATLALRGFAPAAVIGAAQGMLVAVVVEIVAQYDASRWWGFAGVAMLAGVAFAAVNQALVAALGGLGRWLSAVLGVAALAAGIISTLPGWLATIANLLPTSPAATALLGEDGVGSAVAALVVWALLALIVTTLAVAARRTTSAKRVLAAA